MSVYSVAREFMERALAAAEARYDRQEARAIAERLVEIIEHEDFHECAELDRPVPPVTDSDPE